MNKKTVIIVPEGFFAFSLPQKSKSDLTHWREWFRSKGIKTKTIQNLKGEWILCREGAPSNLKM